MLYSLARNTPPRNSPPPGFIPGAAAAAQDASAMECSIYQNYSASEVFVQGVAGMVDPQDGEAKIRAQKKM